MTTRVDDRTQVLLVSLKTEAQLLKAWMARRSEVAQRRREGPLEALRYRLALLDKQLPRLEREVASLESAWLRLARPRPPLRTFCSGLLRGGGLVLAALLWVAGVAALTPGLRADDPLRLAAMLSVVVVIAWVRRGRAS